MNIQVGSYVWVGSICIDGKITLYADRTNAGVLAQIVKYCRKEWQDSNLDVTFAPLPDNDRDAIIQYFEWCKSHCFEEYCNIDQIKLEN